jgi:hypothetical protein
MGYKGERTMRNPNRNQPWLAWLGYGVLAILIFNVGWLWGSNVNQWNDQDDEETAVLESSVTTMIIVTEPIESLPSYVITEHCDNTLGIIRSDHLDEIEREQREIPIDRTNIDGWSQHWSGLPYWTVAEDLVELAAYNYYEHEPWCFSMCICAYTIFHFVPHDTVVQANANDPGYWRSIINSDGELMTGEQARDILANGGVIGGRRGNIEE